MKGYHSPSHWVAVVRHCQGYQGPNQAAKALLIDKDLWTASYSRLHRRGIFSTSSREWRGGGVPNSEPEQPAAGNTGVPKSEPIHAVPCCEIGAGDALPQWVADAQHRHAHAFARGVATDPGYGRRTVSGHDQDFTTPAEQNASEGRPRRLVSDGRKRRHAEVGILAWRFCHFCFGDLAPASGGADRLSASLSGTASLSTSA